MHYMHVVLVLPVLRVLHYVLNGQYMLDCIDIRRSDRCDQPIEVLPTPEKSRVSLAKKTHHIPS